MIYFFIFFTNKFQDTLNLLKAQKLRQMVDFSRRTCSLIAHNLFSTFEGFSSCFFENFKLIRLNKQIQTKFIFRSNGKYRENPINQKLLYSTPQTNFPIKFKILRVNEFSLWYRFMHDQAKRRSIVARRR